ncbi:zinc finger MYM-type protein 1-like [Aphis craccivora]|uniref:Zinc finger MYM-type protein 1-like n=1 Tax=Aphis craccivora TaxID=307492 RepID=A0A6G0WYF0_APHCR|nr:zinc finger MYM-type protein 1-like [Aphis craccivora]
MGQPFMGHKEREEDSNRRMFLELAWLLKKYDPILKKHLEEGPQNATYISNILIRNLEYWVALKFITCAKRFQSPFNDRQPQYSAMIMIL